MQKIKEFLKKHEETIKHTFVLIVFVYLFYLVLSFTVFVNAYIPSASMYPTIEVNDRLYGNRLAYFTSNPQREDIVIFKHDGNLLIKRVIGLPNETISCKDGVIYINGEVYDDLYSYGITSDFEEITIPENSYFVMGDNREHSKDSRAWGYITSENVVAKAEFIYYPEYQTLDN